MLADGSGPPAILRQPPREDTVAAERYRIGMTRLFLFNKPFRALSPFADRGSPTVRSTLSVFIKAKGIYPAGRLDRTSEGLLLRDNERLQAWIADPRCKMPKSCLVQGEGDPQELERLRRGVLLKDGMPLPAAVARVDDPNFSRAIRRSVSASSFPRDG